MKTLMFLFLIAVNTALYAAPTVEIRGVSPTQVKVQVTDNSTPCTFQISESPSLSPLHPDVDPAHFAGANTEAAHVKQQWSSGSNVIRLLLFGLRTAQVSSSTNLRVGRAFTQDTVYYLAATCGSGTTTTTFKTTSIRGVVPEEPPLDATAFGQLAYPEWNDFSKGITDYRGSKIFTTDPNSWGSTRAASISTLSFTSGASGWTGNVTPYLGTGATTSNTNPLFVALDTWHSDPNTCGVTAGCPFNDQWDTIGGYWYDNWTDIAVDLHGVAGSGTGNDAKLDICLSGDSGQTCLSPHQVGTLPTGSAGNVQVPNTTDGAAANYPTAYFKGWGKRIERRYWPHQGMVSVTSSVVTLTKQGAGPFFSAAAVGSGPQVDNSLFDPTWVAGTKIWIVGSSTASGGACANDFCTIASVTDQKHLVVSESIASMTGDNFYQSAAFGVIVKRLSTNSSVTFSMQFHLAKSYPQDIGFYGGFSLGTTTSVDGITGYPSLWAGFGTTGSPRMAPGALYFIGLSGPGAPVIRFISPFSSGGACGQGSDCPSGNNLGPIGAFFNETDPTKIYFLHTSGAGKLSLYQATYNAATYGWLPYSNWQTSYGSSDVAAPPTGELSYINLTPGANDVTSQITAHVPGYNTAVLSSGALQLRGTIGPFALMDVGGQNTASWIIVFCVTNAGPCASAGAGGFYKAYYTSDSGHYVGATDPSPAGVLRYSGSHATTPTFGSSSVKGYTFSVATHEMQYGNSTWQGGPYTSQISAISRSGTMVPIGSGLGTSLTWPPNPANYDSACPGGLPADIVAGGATGNNCALVQAKMPCSSFAGTPEATDRPCPYNSAWSYQGGFQLRDMFKDNGLGGIGDNEGFKVITVPTSVGGNVWQFYIQRDANSSYCTKQHDNITGLPSDAQFTHADGWGLTMWPSDSCAGGGQPVIDIVNDTVSIPNQNMQRGHGGMVTVSSNTVNRIASGSVTPHGQVYVYANNRAIANIGQPGDGQTPQDPNFANFTADSYQSTQSYVDAKAPLASLSLKQYSVDWSHVDPSAGAELEYPGGVVGVTNNPTLVAGTTTVYKVLVSDTPHIKQAPIFAWIGTHYLIDVSNPTTSSNQITDSTPPWRKCFAYKNGECRITSTAGDFFVTMPVPQFGYNRCTSSQMNILAPCAFAGPTQIGQLRMVWSASPDGNATKQIYLGWGAMGPEHQQVYSNFLPSPDGLYGVFPMIGQSGYHTGLGMIQMPDVTHLDSLNRTTFARVTVSGNSSAAVYVEFGYDEFGSDGVTKFYCTSRKENCQVAGSTINENNPFQYVLGGDTPVTTTGAYTIAIPVLPQHTVYYHVVTGGVAGPTNFEVVN